MATKCDMVVDVEWKTDHLEKEEHGYIERWVIPHDVYNDADGETADLNMVLCDYLSEETGWSVVSWTFVEERPAIA